MSRVKIAHLYPWKHEHFEILCYTAGSQRPHTSWCATIQTCHCTYVQHQLKISPKSWWWTFGFSFSGVSACSVVLKSSRATFCNHIRYNFFWYKLELMRSQEIKRPQTDVEWIWFELESSEITLFTLLLARVLWGAQCGEHPWFILQTRQRN